MTGRKNLRITTIMSDGKRVTRNLRTPPGQLFTESGIDALLEREAARVEEFFPGRDFRLVPLRDGSFNFVETLKASA